MDIFRVLGSIILTIVALIIILILGIVLVELVKAIYKEIRTNYYNDEDKKEENNK